MSRRHLRGRDLRDPGIRPDGGRQRREDGGVARDVDRDDQRAVGAGSETVRDQVVGPPLRARLRHRPLVGEAEAERRHRRRQGEQQDRGADGVRRRVPSHVGAPPAPPEARGVLAAGAAPVDPVARDPQQRRQQGDGCEHHHQHDQGDPDAPGGDERDPGDGETQDRHDDGATGEDDRPAGGGQRAADGVLDVAALGEVLTEPGQDEQRVVDADAESDHRSDDDRPAGDVDEVGHHGQRPGADREAEQGRPDRQPHGHDGPEGQQQDHDRDPQAEGFADTGRRLLEREVQVAAGLDAQGRRRCGGRRGSS